MARPERNNVDYFPFLCKEGKSMYYIEEKYKNDGFATWIKILRQLAVTDYHYLNLSQKTDRMFLSSKCKVSEEVLEAIINDLVELGEFESDLWLENKIIFSTKFIAHIEDAYDKRKTKCITLPGLLTLLDSLGIRKLSKSTLKGSDNTQSKVKETKEDKSKVSDAGEPATIEQRCKIFFDRVFAFEGRYARSTLQEFYDYWTEKNEGGRRVRFEMQKVFDIQKRLVTWSKNEKQQYHGTRKSNQGTVRRADAVIETGRDFGEL